MAFAWKLIESDCTGCGICVDVCSSATLRMTRMMAYPEPLAGKCAGCMDCAHECPFDAIVVQELAAATVPS